jgi:opacity protein-like surface antigen
MDRIGSTRKSALLSGSALMLILSSASGAMAQNCTSTPLRPGFAELGGFAAATASSISGSFGNVSTAFLTQQGSAFVANPGGAPPNTQGGGVWARGVGGEVTVDSRSTTTANQTPVLDPAIDSGTINCTSRQRETFGGIQVGADIARLNWDGWNINFGTTAGYLEANSRELNGVLRTHFEVPFAGLYAVVTKGGFFADLMLREEFYNITLNDPASNLHNQGLGARGHTVSASAGYQFALQNNWFVEPSAGFTWSRTKIDPLNVVGLPDTGTFADPRPGAELSGTLLFNPVESEIGRLSLRVGTSFTNGNLALQPFATASVFHEFSGDIRSTYTTCANCVFVAGTPVTSTLVTDSSRVGTYAQFSLGLAGQVLNTGLVGFVRGDYRTGDNIDGWTANAGLRYNFLPELPPAVHKGIVKAPPPPVVTAVNWTGFYVGGFLGMDSGTARISFADGTTSKPKLAGIIGGGQVGYNHQFNRIVLGVEGDIGLTNKQGTRACGNNTGDLDGDGLTDSFSPFFQTCSSGMDWLATLTGRVGFTWERALFYVKGGGAWTQEDISIGCVLGPNNGAAINARNCINPAGLLTNGSTGSIDRFGWVVGYGSEFALNANWSAKAEFNYIDFGRDNVLTTDGTGLNVKTHLTEVKVGVNYRFGSLTR